MNPFKSAINKLKAVTELKPEEVFLESVGVEEEKLIIRLNTEGEPTSQLFVEGINSEGQTLESIGGGYSPLTIELKKEKGQPFNRVTLNDTGDFYKSWTIRRNKQGLIIVVDPIKDDTNLLDEWGKDILGLTKENKAILNEKILPKAQKFILETFSKA